MKTKFLVSLMMVLAFWSCDDTSVSPEGLQLKMKATTTTSRITSSGRVQSTGYSFEKALLGVRKFEFETTEDDDLDDDSNEVEFEGSYVVDLIAGTSDPEFVNGKLTPGFYEEFEIELGRTLADNNTVLIVFKYKPAEGDSVTVEFSSKSELEFEYEDDNGFEIQEGNLSNFLVLFNLDVLFEGVDLSKATVSDDGIIRINDSSNTSLASIVKNNFDDSCKGGKDDDDDDDIDDDDDNDDDDDDNG